MRLVSLVPSTDYPVSPGFLAVLLGLLLAPIPELFRHVRSTILRILHRRHDILPRIRQLQASPRDDVSTILLGCDIPRQASPEFCVRPELGLIQQRREHHHHELGYMPPDVRSHNSGVLHHADDPLTAVPPGHVDGQEPVSHLRDGIVPRRVLGAAFGELGEVHSILRSVRLGYV